MFDRILQIINKCSSKTFDRQTVDEALMVYFEKGAAESENFLITTKKFSVEQATQLVSDIEKENNRLNRQALLINSIGFLSAAVLFFVSILSFGYFFMVIFGLTTILWWIALRKSLLRYWRRVKHPYIPASPS